MGVILVSPDERTVATAWVLGDGDPAKLAIRVGDGPTLRRKRAGPIGFDASGQLLAGTAKGVVRIDPRSGRSTVLRASRGLPDQQLVTPSGRYLVTYGARSYPGADDRSLAVLDLVDGDRRTWQLPADAWWSLSDLTDDRYVVLSRENDDIDEVSTATEWAVVDLMEGWLGFIPFCPPSGSAATETHGP